MSRKTTSIDKEKIKDMLGSLINEEEFNVKSVSEAISKAVSFINKEAELNYFDSENILNNREVIFDIIQNDLFEDKVDSVCDLIKSGDLNLFEPLLKNDFLNQGDGSSMDGIISSPLYLSITSGNKKVFNACSEYIKENNIDLESFDASSYIHFDLIDSSNLIESKHEPDDLKYNRILSVKDILEATSLQSEENIKDGSKNKKRKINYMREHKKQNFDTSKIFNSDIVFNSGDLKDSVLFTKGEENTDLDDGIFTVKNSEYIQNDPDNKNSDFYHIKIPLILYAVIFEKDNEITKDLLSFYNKIDKETALEILSMKQSFDLTKVSSGNFKRMSFASVSSSSFSSENFSFDFSFQDNPNIEFSRLISFNKKNENATDNKIVDAVLDKMSLLDCDDDKHKVNGLIMTPLMGDLLADEDLRRKIIKKAKKDNVKINLTSAYESLSLIKSKYKDGYKNSFNEDIYESKFRVNWEDEKTALHDIIDVIDINERGIYGETILHWAAHCGDYELIKKAIKLGADTDALNYDNLTPLDMINKNLDNDTFIELSLENKDDIEDTNVIGTKNKIKRTGTSKEDVLTRSRDILILYSNTNKASKDIDARQSIKI